MPTITIKFDADTLTFTKRNGATVTQSIVDISDSVFADIFEYGWKQKVNDAASACPDKASAQKAMSEATENLAAGLWAMRGVGEPADPQAAGRRSVALDWIKAGETPEAKAALVAYEAIPAKDQAARLAYRDMVFADNADAIKAWIVARVAAF